MDGVKEELTTANVSRILTSPRQTPSINTFKIYFKNDGESITLSVDRDGYINGKDYEFTYIDHNSSAVNRFKGGRIKLARVDDGVSVYWVNYDNVMVSKGKLQKVLPRELGQLYVNPGTGDDSFDGSLSKPFKTINKALESSFPGDEIILQDGVYDEKIEFKSSRMYGEEGKLLTIRPQNRHKATFVTDVNLKYGDYVRLEGFEINGKSVFIGGSTGVEVIDNCCKRYLRICSVQGCI